MGDDCTRLTVDEVVFRLPDPSPQITAVRLWQDAGLSAEQTAFTRCDPAEEPDQPEQPDHDDEPDQTDRTGQTDQLGWTLRLPLTALHDLGRLEYQYVLSTGDGEEYRLDPTNPRRVGGAFGDKSNLELPGYRPPAWLADADDDLGSHTPFSVETDAGVIDGLLWAPEPGPLPVLLAHDGAELAEYAEVVRYARAMVASRRLPAFAVALLSPGSRDERYSANPDYAAALADKVVPHLASLGHHSPVIAGASLGGLAALHAEWTRPGTFVGVFSQSGSFFTPETDGMESSFPWFDRITGFSAEVRSAHQSPTSARVVQTCGVREENIHCNRLLATELQRLGIGSPLVENPDLHTWTGWRDTLHPNLTRLLATVWSPGQGRVTTEERSSEPVQDGEEGGTDAA